MIDPYLLAAAMNSGTSLVLAIFVYFKGRKPLHRYWLLMNICVSVWALLVGIEMLVFDPQLHVLLDRIEQGFAVCIPVFFLHCTMYLASPQLPQMWVAPLRLAYLSTFGLITLVPTPLFISGAKPQPIWGGRLYDVGGPLYFLFPTLYAILVSYAVVILSRAIRTTSSRNSRIGLSLFLSGTVLSFLLGATCFPLVFDIQIPPIGFLLVWLYTALTTYAMLRHQLWDINVVIRRSIVYSLLITVLTIGYFGLAYSAERVFQMAFGYRSFWISLAAFASMALIFQPLKIGIQRVVDLLMFRAPQHAVAKRLEVLEQKVREGEQYKAVATMAAEIAHEMKNPLTAMQTFVEFLPERHDDTQFRQRFHEVVSSEIRRLRQVAQGLLDFAKPQIPRMAVVDIKGVVEDVLALTKPMLLKRAIEVQTAYAHNGATLVGDAMHLRQVFLNLIRNADQAMPPGGALTIHTASQNGWLEVRVTDTGCGIHSRHLQHLFEPFFSKKPDGTGLGLAIVQGIVREHRGTIGVESAPGRGTTVTVRLPIA